MTSDSGIDLRELATAERRDLADFLTTLTPEQWEAPTLCADWRVRDVVAHIISYDGLDARALLVRLARSRLTLRRANAAGVAAADRRTPEQLLDDLRSWLRPRGLTTAFGGMVGLLDCVIHHQDIRRPLVMPREIPPERLRPALRSALLAPPIGAFWRARGLRLVATDVDWAAGRGPEVRGAGEAVLLSIAGRSGVVDELSGPGQPRLAARLSPR